MFEVGKKYRQNGNSNIMRVLFLTDTNALVTYDFIKDPQVFVKVGRELLWKREETENIWHEYKEPVVVKVRKNVAVFSGGGVLLGNENWQPYDGDVHSMSKIQMTITDGKLTGVEIVH